MTTALLGFACVIAILPPSEATTLPPDYDDGGGDPPIVPEDTEPTSTNPFEVNEQSGTWEWFKDKYGT